MPDRVKFTKLTKGTKEALALDKVNYDQNTHKLTLYSSVDDSFKEETTIPIGENGFVTPEMYGAFGDNQHDDTAAFARAISSGRIVYCKGKYLVSNISAKNVYLELEPEAEINRLVSDNPAVEEEAQAVPFININPNRVEHGDITYRSIITGGTIDAKCASIGVAINGSEQFIMDNTQIKDAHIGLYLAYKPEEGPRYNIESRITNTKFINVLYKMENPSSFVDSVGIVDMGTDSQFSNIIIENAHTGMVVGGNSEISQVHHWIAREEIFDGSVTFRLDENKSGYFNNCCSDSVEQAFYMDDYAAALVSGFSQLRNSYMTNKKNMYYLVARPGNNPEPQEGEEAQPYDYGAASYISFFSYGSTHRGNSNVNVNFYEVSENIYKRYEVNGMTYSNRLIIDGAIIGVMHERNNIIPFGYNGLGPLKNFCGYDDSNKNNFDFNDIMENGVFSVQMNTSSHGPDGVTTGLSNLIVSGTSFSKMQMLINNTQGIYYRFYNGAWQPWRMLGDTIAQTIPAISNFSGDWNYAYLRNCDLDTVVTPGMYGIQVSTASNLPSSVTSGNLSLWVGGVYNETIPIVTLMQMAIAKDKMFIRSCGYNSGQRSWTPWVAVYTESDLSLIVQAATTSITSTVPAIKNFSGDWRYTWLMNCDLDTVTVPGMYGIQVSTASNLPSEVTSGTLNLWVGGAYSESGTIITSLVQMGITKDRIYIRVRQKTSSGYTWTAWANIGSSLGTLINFDGTQNHCWKGVINLDNLTETGCFGINPSGSTNLPTEVTSGKTVVWVGGSPNCKIQTLTNPAGVYYRIWDGSAWSAWTQGSGGGQGQDGITPTVSVTSISGGHNVAFSYGSGDSRNTNFDVMNGINGSDGAQGPQGIQGPPGDPITIESYIHDDATLQTHVYFSDGNQVDIPDGQQGAQGPQGDPMTIDSYYNEDGYTYINFYDGTRVEIPDGKPGESITISYSYHDDLSNQTIVVLSDNSQIEIPDGAQGPTGNPITITSAEHDDETGITAIIFSDETKVEIPDGQPGPAGSDYVLTAQDKADIAAAAAALLENGDSLSY